MNFKFALSRDLNLESRNYLQVTRTAQVGSFPSPRPFAKNPIPGIKSSFAIDFFRLFMTYSKAKFRGFWDFSPQ